MNKKILPLSGRIFYTPKDKARPDAGTGLCFVTGIR
jgi:hypothetical protein